jgi:hypothetical protein
VSDEYRLNLKELWDEVRDELGVGRRKTAMTPVIFAADGQVRSCTASDVMVATLAVLERHGFVGTESRERDAEKGEG